jgi:hypothetical protein
MTEATEKMIAAVALAVIVWLMFTAGPLIAEGFAR